MIWLSFDSWSNGAYNRRLLSHRFKRIYIKGRWTPFVIHWWTILNNQELKRFEG